MYYEFEDFCEYVAGGLEGVLTNAELRSELDAGSSWVDVKEGHILYIQSDRSPFPRPGILLDKVYATYNDLYQMDSRTADKNAIELVAKMYETAYTQKKEGYVQEKQREEMYHSVKDHLCLRICTREEYGQRQTDGQATAMLSSMGQTYAVAIFTMKENDTLDTAELMPITANHLTEWNKTADEVAAAARDNMRALFPVKAEELKDDDLTMSVIMNQLGDGGLSALVYAEDLINDIAAEKGDLTIVPLNEHVMVALPVGTADDYHETIDILADLRKIDSERAVIEAPMIYDQKNKRMMTGKEEIEAYLEQKSRGALTNEATQPEGRETEPTESVGAIQTKPQKKKGLLAGLLEKRK